MRFRVRFTQEAQADLERLFDFILQRDQGHFAAAERALDAIRHGTALLETSPFSCRRAASGNAFLRELIIAFGAAGYVALFEIDNSSTVTVLAMRHQREDDFH
jgi:plasmid stabilization system protein ParE